jgi:hypothetical protein
MLQVNSKSDFLLRLPTEMALSLMHLTPSLPQFEEPDEVLSSATINDAVNVFIESSEQGYFEEHFTAALWIDGLPGRDVTRLISLEFAHWQGICPDGRHGPGGVVSSRFPPRLLLSRVLPPLRSSLLCPPIFTAPFFTALASAIKSPFLKCPPSAFSPDSIRYLAILALWAESDSCDGRCSPACYFYRLALDVFSTDSGPKSFEFCAALIRSRRHLLDLPDLFAAYPIAVSAVMSHPQWTQVPAC